MDGHLPPSTEQAAGTPRQHVTPTPTTSGESPPVGGSRGEKTPHPNGAVRELVRALLAQGLDQKNPKP
eukprot:747664-Rhodomonas_salina.1